MRIQKRVRGGRKRLSPSVLKEIRDKVHEISRRYKVSYSFVISTILAEALHIKKQEKYYE